MQRIRVNSEHLNLEKAIKEADVLYATRIQKERFPDAEEYNRVMGSYKINNTLLERQRTT